MEKTITNPVLTRTISSSKKLYMRFIFLVLIFLTLDSHSQKLNNVNLHIPRIVVNDPEIITLRPIDKIKITFRAGIHFSNDIDQKGYYSMIGYEYRVKYYFNQKFRILFKNQVLSLGQNNYSVGLQLKF